MVSAICADKRIGDPLEGMSLSDCGERCEGEEECEFHTYAPSQSKDDDEFTKGTCWGVIHHKKRLETEV